MKRHPAKYGHGSTIHDASGRANRPYFILEAGHHPDLVEKIAVWRPAIKQAISVAFLGASIGTLYGLAASLPGAASWGLWTAGAFVALHLHQRAGRALLRSLPDSRLWIFFPFESGRLRARDKTMAANLARALVVLSDGARLLAIVGKAHVPGIKMHLVKRHGFEEVGLNALTRK